MILGMLVITVTVDRFYLSVSGTGLPWLFWTRSVKWVLLLMTDIGANGESSPGHSPVSRMNGKSQSPTPVPAMLVMSGGEGYIDFRVGSSNAGNITRTFEAENLRVRCQSLSRDVGVCFQCFDAVGWMAETADGL